MKSRAWMVVPIMIVFAAGVNLYRHNRAELRVKETAARGAELKNRLASMRKAIESFRADQGHYPHSLRELTPKYIRAIPADPLTNAADWRVITEERVEASSDFTTGDAAPSPGLRVIIDVRSSAPGKDASGRLYSDY